MTGVIVFDEQDVARQVSLLDPDVLVFDDRSTLEIAPANEYDVISFELETDTEFLIFDAPAPIVDTVLAPEDFLLIDEPTVPTVISQETQEELLVITTAGLPGDPGPQGPQGAPGPPGQDGAGAYYASFNFALPSTVWTIVHNKDTFALTVETFDQSGTPIEGTVRYVDLNTIEVDWFYPMAGEARVFR
jgi:hypothetical protein